MENYCFEPIGFIESKLKYRYETPRQGVLSLNNLSVIKLNNHNNFHQALEGLEGFDRIWVIYLFHLNNNWKPKVYPPRHFNKKIGVFATRSPHRPNKIGLSCVKLEKIEGLNIFISESDILDGTPVIDIKPYLPYSDSFPDAKTGWVKYNLNDKFTVSFSEIANKQIEFLYSHFNINLNNFATLQLEFEPTNTKRKRISKLSDNSYVLSYRTWRILFSVEDDLKLVKINKIFSGYSEQDLQNLQDDKYNDKIIHIDFAKQTF
jgi:tRNA-Thr(GGU) m(6)t(6)A37 methyltransferase TsaA